MKVKGESEVTQSCPIFHDTMDCSLPGSSIHGIFQARVLEWPFSSQVICISEVIDVSPGNLDSRLCSIQPNISHDGLCIKGFPSGSAGKESTCKAGDLCLIPGLGRSPEEGNGYPLQYSGLENSTDCIDHVVTKTWTQLSDFQFTLLRIQVK